MTVLDRWLPTLGAWAFRLMAPTLRFEIENDELLVAHHESGKPLVVCGFHGQLLLGVLPLRPYAPIITVSHSRDGERIARVVERLGWRTVRGSSSRGGVQALLRLVRSLKSEGGIAGHVPDGPRGPSRVVQSGVLLLAQRAGAPILPIYLAGRPVITMRSWDRMRVPLPFTRIRVRFDEPMWVPAKLDASDFEALRSQLEERMGTGQAALEAEI